MDLKTLKHTPPWDWPEGAGMMFLEILTDDQADESDRLLAAELAGGFTVINDELAEALLSILCSGGEPERLRSRAVISFGPAIEHADTYGYEDTDDVVITEQTFHRIQESFRTLYRDADVPKEIRRRILEASVRAQQDWHQAAIRAAYFSGDRDWILTAVFSMRWVRGFDDQILESLESEDDDVHYQAVRAAGNWEIEAAWPHVSNLVATKTADKSLLLAAIEAVAGIRPQEAGVSLVDLLDSKDEDIVEAAFEAMAIAEGLPDEEFDEDDDEESLC